ncbi:M50 family metallopeptidase [Brevibacillus fulvus]|uniref:Membrane-associated protease RseP (Regulator of RpoE activity) n=1 Tax=Brevibacillus fulvus TaxID=1125967 RepID=A0A938XZP7_9BACL|nr:M50 family metallopeptidase [Brevibacillus fulvus]MBM7590711.1 membrane-associated protease RseP (regulator of RpoE activity) [Brevibacillus fulvus]
MNNLLEGLLVCMQSLMKWGIVGLFSVTMHEMGHALAIIFCKGRIHRINIGSGWEMLRINKLSLRSFWLGGMVEWDANDPKITSRKLIFIALSGVGFNYSVGLCFGWLIFGLPPLPNQLFNLSFGEIYRIILVLDLLNLAPVGHLDGEVVKLGIQELISQRRSKQIQVTDSD